MVSLCYPYGTPITCVCDPRGQVYNCFPSDGGLKRGIGARLGGAQGDVASKRDRNVSEGDIDQRTEVVLATTALVAVVALFLSFLIYRMEKYLVSNGFQLPVFHQCFKDGKLSGQKNSSYVQTDPVLYCYSHSQTFVGITHFSNIPTTVCSNTQPPRYQTPIRRFSYSPDSTEVNSTRPSMSSTLPLPRSRSQSSPYELYTEEQKEDQISPPIELMELNLAAVPLRGDSNIRYTNEKDDELKIQPTTCNNQPNEDIQNNPRDQLYQHVSITQPITDTNHTDEDENMTEENTYDHIKSPSDYFHHQTYTDHQSEDISDHLMATSLSQQPLIN